MTAPYLTYEAEIPGADLSFKATGDYRLKQYYYMKMSTTVGYCELCDELSPLGLGILMTKPYTGEVGRIRTLGVAPAIANGAVSVGALVGPAGDDSGQLMARVPTIGDVIVGRALTAASGTGYTFSVLLGTPYIFTTVVDNEN